MRTSLILASALLALMLALLGLYLVKGTMSWLRAFDAASNRLSAEDPELHASAVDIFHEPDDPVEPNDEIVKKVGATNTGKRDIFVRLMVFPVMTSKDGQPLPASIGKEVHLIGLNNTTWRDGGDGYYYYLKTLGPAGSPTATSDLLFQAVTLDPSLSSEYQNADLEIDVRIEAIETMGLSYRTAFWGNQNPPGGTILPGIDAVYFGLKQ